MRINTGDTFIGPGYLIANHLQLNLHESLPFGKPVPELRGVMACL